MMSLVKASSRYFLYVDVSTNTVREYWKEKAEERGLVHTATVPAKGKDWYEWTLKFNKTFLDYTFLARM